MAIFYLGRWLRRPNCKPAMPLLNWQLAIIFVLGCFALGLLTLWTP